MIREFINYTIGIHTNDDYKELFMKFDAPVSIGDHISEGVGEDEFLVESIVHYHEDQTILHCKPLV